MFKVSTESVDSKIVNGCGGDVMLLITFYIGGLFTGTALGFIVSMFITDRWMSKKEKPEDETKKEIDKMILRSLQRMEKKIIEVDPDKEEIAYQ